MIGIICEYNPFHNGHLYHLNKVKEMFPNQVITLVLVGNFLNRGEVSVVEKYDKTKLALDYGVDLVVELPTCFAIQAADIYAYGAITILDNLNCDYLVFGSESNDLEVLDKIAQFQLDNNIELSKYVKKGYNYPTSLSLAIQENLSIKIDSPNDLLAISYIKAIKKLNSKIKPVTIKRTNDYHDDKTTGKISSATSIRKLIYDNQDIAKYVPKSTVKYVKNIKLNDFFLIIKYKIMTEDLTKYQDIDVNLSRSLKKHISTSNDIDTLIMKVKSKNYTYNKIKRCLVHILCCLEKNKYDIDYIYVLGFNQKGREYLNKIKKNIRLPLITNYDKLLDYQILVDNIYNLINNENNINKPIFKNN